MKLLRTIRLDPSDTFVFERAAEPGEWAVTGAFVFSESDPATLQGKERTAFRAGFLGVESLGWSTLVQIVEASADDRSRLVEHLAGQMLKLGAPDLAAGRLAAEEEVDFAESLCTPPKDTLIAVHRSFEAGELRETFRTLQPRNGPKPLRAFAFIDVAGEEDIAEEHVDLMKLSEDSRK
ncbi:MAG: DUF6505 family protein [Pseudorhodoplanes sp.]